MDATSVRTYGGGIIAIAVAITIIAIAVIITIINISTW